MVNVSGVVVLPGPGVRVRLTSCVEYVSVACVPLVPVRRFARIVKLTHPLTAVCGDGVTCVVAPLSMLFTSEITSFEPVPVVTVLPEASATQIVAVVVEAPFAGSGLPAVAGGLFDSVSCVAPAARNPLKVIEAVVVLLKAGELAWVSVKVTVHV